MNILFFSDNFPPEVNAAASRVFERACYWIKQGHRVTVVTCAPNFPHGVIYPGYKNKWYQKEIIQGIEVIRVKTFLAKNEGVLLRTLDFLSYLLVATPIAFFLKKPDIVVATSPQLFVGMAGCLTASYKRVPFVLELSDLWPASISALGALKNNFILKTLEKLELFLYRKAKAIITLTHSIKNDLVRRNIPQEKISVVINGVDLSRYSPQPRDLELAKEYGINNHFVVGYIGTHGIAQGLETIVKAAKKLEQEVGIRFLFVGTGAVKDQLLAQAKAENLQNIIFVNPQPKELMPAIWSLCNLALIPLKNVPLFTGALPSKMFEAMGMGIPLLLSAPKGEASVIVEETGIGVHIPPEDPDVLAVTVQYLAQNCLELQNMTAKCRQVARRFTREHQANDFLTVLKSVLEYNDLVNKKIDCH